MRVYAQHKTLNGGNYFETTCDFIKHSLEGWQFSIRDFEAWWLSQLIKHKQKVTFYIIHETEIPQFWPVSMYDAEDVCRLLYDPPRFEGGKDKPIFFHSGPYKVVEPRNMFFKGSA